jgi:hypothetical protein
MNTRVGRRTWLTLSALVVILLFATVAADAKLQGTRPPKSASFPRTDFAACPNPARCAAPPLSVRKAARAHRSDDCAAPLLQTL